MKLKIAFAQEITTGTVQAKIKVESQNWGILDMMPTFINATVVQGAAGATTWYIETPYVVQGALESDGLTAATITIIDDKTETMLMNFSSAVVPVFNKGINYLVPYSAGVVLNMLPPQNTIVCQQTEALQTTQVGGTVSSMTYHFKAQEQTQPLGGAQPTCITFDSDDKAMLALMVRKANNAASRLMS